MHVMRSTNPLYMYVSCKPSNLLYTPLRMGYIYHRQDWCGHSTILASRPMLSESFPDQCWSSTSLLQHITAPVSHMPQCKTSGTEAKFVHARAQGPTCRMLTISLQHTQHSLIPKQDGSGLGMRLHTIARPHPIKHCPQMVSPFQLNGLSTLTGRAMASTSFPVMFLLAFVATVWVVPGNSAITVFRPTLERINQCHQYNAQSSLYEGDTL